jgi:hypothetical protein
MAAHLREMEQPPGRASHVATLLTAVQLPVATRSVHTERSKLDVLRLPRSRNTGMIGSYLRDGSPFAASTKPTVTDKEVCSADAAVTAKASSDTASMLRVGVSLSKRPQFDLVDRKHVNRR